MNILVRDKSLIAVGLGDFVKSIVWVERYNSPGEFEIYTPVSNQALQLFQEDYYVTIPLSDRIMIIESLEIKTNVETENVLIVKGRSFESVLDRRIMIGQTLIDGSLQDAIEQILNENIIDSSQPLRNIPNFVFSASNDPAITELLLKAQYDGDNLGDVIPYLCQNSNIGFKIILNASNQFSFSIYAGQDRSFAQSTNSYVIFSPSFDNLLNSSFFHSKRFRKTYSLLFGDNSAGAAHRVEAYPEPLLDYALLSGLDRREIWFDASDLSKFYEGTQTELPVQDYIDQVRERGRQELRNFTEVSIFEGQADTSIEFTYGSDFFLGDIVQIENEYGFKDRVRLTEMTISEDLNGLTMIPTFDKV